MALKTLMLRKRIDEKNAALETLRNACSDFEKREAEIEAAIAEAETEEEKTACEEAVEAFETEKSEHEEKRNGLQNELEALEAELAEEERKAAEVDKQPENERKETTEMDERTERIQMEKRAFANFVRGIETRDDYNMTQGNNGKIVPTTIASEIITKVTERCPIVEKAHRYNVKGKLSIPFYPASSDHVIAAAYKDEMSDLVASSGDFDTVDLTGFEAGALAKISKKLINNTDIDVVRFTTEQLVEAFAAFYEKELLVGTNNKTTGLIAGITNVKTLSAKDYCTVDDLISIQAGIPSALQAGCCWIMKPSTFEIIKKRKDGEGRYVLNPDIRAEFGYTLLGKPVYITDNMPALGTANNKAIVYGDLSGLAFKMTEDLEVEVLLEKFATQHAIGIMGWTEIDAKVENAQKFVVAKCASANPQ